MTITEIKSLVHDTIDTNSSDFPDARMVRGINKAQNKIVNIILENDGALAWDDDSFGDLPEGYLNLSANQRDYNLTEDENFADILAVIKVLIRDDNNTTWTEVKRISTDDIETSLIKKEGETGIPAYYRMSGKKMLLYPTPDYTESNGILVYFIRKPKDVTVSDTTRELSIPATFHPLVALYTAYDYARAKRMDNRNDILNEILMEEKRLGLHVTNQNKNLKVVISPKIFSSE